MLLGAETAPVRSSMERMLDMIRLRDEQPPGAPPALPARPTSRGRLPSSQRRPLLQVQLKQGGGVPLPTVLKSRISYTPITTSSLLEISDKAGVTDQIAVAEDAWSRSLPEIISVQKQFRGRRARCSYEELKRGVTTLQSFVRGERIRSRFEWMSRRWRAAVVIQRFVKGWIVRREIDEQRRDVILLQSVTRGWLARRHLVVLREKLSKPGEIEVNGDPDENSREVKDTEKEHPQVILPSVLAELQMRVLQAEAALKHKEDENVTLRDQLQQYETRWLEYDASKESMSALKDKEEENAMLREQLQQSERKWSEYEVRMKSMEESWQKQLTSLQVSLAMARKKLTANESPAEPVECDASSDHVYFDSDDSISTETHTPDGTSVKKSPPETHTPDGTSVKKSRPCSSEPCTPPANQSQLSSDATLSRTSVETRSAVRHLAEEYDEQRRAFEESAGFLMKMKSGRSKSMVNTNEEFRNLTVRFDAWRKDYKLRLKEVKVGLKHGNSARKRWWTPSCTR